MSSEYLQSKNEVYRRLDHDDDIVSCLDLSGEGIRLALMENGNLQELPRQTPDQSRQLAWFRAMAHALVHVHDRRVLAADIVTGTFSSPPTSMSSNQTLISQPFYHLMLIWRPPMTPAIRSIPTLANLAPYLTQSRLRRCANSTSSRTYPMSRPTPSGCRGRFSPARRTYALVPLLRDVGPRPHPGIRASFQPR